MTNISLKKKILFSIVFFFIILIPFLIAELFLNLAGKGYNTDPFIQNSNIEGFYIDNTDFLTKYHTSSGIKTSNSKNMFTYNKRPNSLRGFVIGGSTAQGYPYPSNQSFSKIVEKQLAASEKYDQVEVINLGYSAMSSFYVKDVIAKIYKYDPDFIIIYSGHNEYYGTISATTGGTYFSKNLYLGLKELKLFQSIYNRERAGESTELKGNLMTKQFNNNEITIGSMYNNIAVNHYGKNIKKIVELSTDKSIPTFFVEPVSNIIDMPPFSSESNQDDLNLYYQIKDLYDKNNFSELEKLIDNNKTFLEETKSALLSYITGMSKLKLDHLEYDFYLKRAKDLDTIPFRSRTEILTELKRQTSVDNKFIEFIPLNEILESRYGSDIFSNEIFIDHLHFNLNGQKIVGDVLSETIANYFSFKQEEIDKMINYANDNQKFTDDFHINEFSQVYPYWSVSSIIKSSPYSDMVIKYNFPDISNLFPDNTLAQKRELQEEMFSEVQSISDIYKYIYNYYRKSDHRKCISIIDYFKYNYPMSPVGYLLATEYYSMFKVNDNIINIVLENYLKALFITDYDDNIYNDVISFLEKNEKWDIIKNLNNMYSNNK